jgi:hypothetical protein
MDESEDRNKSGEFTKLENVDNDLTINSQLFDNSLQESINSKEPVLDFESIPEFESINESLNIESKTNADTTLEEESILEFGSILEKEEPNNEINNEIDEIKKQIEITQENNSQTSSNQETLGDSIHDSIISEILPNANINNLENNIIDIIESGITNQTNIMENINNISQVITESNINCFEPSAESNLNCFKPSVSTAESNLNCFKPSGITAESNLNCFEPSANKVNSIIDEVEILKMPESEIIEIDKIPLSYKNLNTHLEIDIYNNNTLKPNVTFSSADLQNIIGLGNINNHSENLSSLNTNSEFSYTKKIKDARQPDLINKQSNKNIRLNNTQSNSHKKKQKKQVDLDEVDYIYNKLQDYSRYLKINITNYMIIITKAMELIENYDDFSPSAGYGKKEVVIKAVNRLVMIDIDLSESDKRVFLSTLSNFIELIIMCSKRYKKYSKSSKDNFSSENNKIDYLILASSGQIVFSLIDKLTTIIIKNQYTAEKITHNIPTITEILMLLADKYDYLTGFEKKNIVLQAIHVFITEKLEQIIDIEQDKKKEIIEILPCVPNTIDLFMALQKQKYKINKKSIIKVKKSGCLNSIFGRKNSYEDD